MYVLACAAQPYSSALHVPALVCPPHTVTVNVQIPQNRKTGIPMCSALLYDTLHLQETLTPSNVPVAHSVPSKLALQALIVLNGT